MYFPSWLSSILFLLHVLMMLPNTTDKKLKMKQVKFDPTKPLNFTIKIEKNEWETIKPDNKEYKDRCASVLQPGWTDLINDKIFEKYRLECPFPMDRHKFYKRKGFPFLKFVGGCDECGASITGTIQEQPHEFPYCIQIETYDTRGIRHVKPKPLKNNKRKDLSEKARHTKPLKLRHQIADECLDDDGNLKSDIKERPNLNSTAVYSKLRQEIKKADTINYPGDDVSEVINLQIKYPNYIRLFSTVPLVLYYWSQNQIDLWNELASLGYYISIDASGKFVKQLTIIEGQKSSPIFFYNVVVRLEKKVYSLSQMLSSKHDVCQISSWLSRWLKSGASIPAGVIVDCAYALLNSVCIEFNHCTYVEFLNKCTNYLLGHSTELPKCNVKRDKAHLIKAISSWNCFKKDNWPKKDFYLRVICFSLEIEVLEELHKVVVDLFVICQSPCQSTQYLESLKNLEEKVATFHHKTFFKEDNSNCADCTHENCSILQETDATVDHAKLDDCSILQETDSPVNQTKRDDSQKEITSKSYILKLKAEADNLLTQDKAKDSTKTNPYRLQKILPNLITLFTQFPAWTNVMHPFYSVRPNKVSTSCGSEIYYRITRIDYGFSYAMLLKMFLLEQMPLLDGATKLARRIVRTLLEKLEEENHNVSSEKLNKTVHGTLFEITNTLNLNDCLNCDENDKVSLKTNKENIEIAAQETKSRKRKTGNCISENSDDIKLCNKKRKNEESNVVKVIAGNLDEEINMIYKIDLNEYKYTILLNDYYYNLPYVNLQKITLTVEDFKSLETPNFVSGNIIDAFMTLKLKYQWEDISIIPTSLTTFIVGDQWDRNHPKSWNMYHLSYNFNGKVFMPYCYKYHWCLIVLDPVNEIATHYDPLYDEPKKRHDYEKAFKHFLSRCANYQIFKNKNWRWIENKIMLPRQKDSWNCGPFIIFYMTFFANSLEGSVDRLAKFNAERYRFEVAALLLKEQESNNDICLYCFNIDKEFYNKKKEEKGVKKCKSCTRWGHNFCITTNNTQLKGGECELCVSRKNLVK